jgi:hypothetical protein
MESFEHIVDIAINCPCWDDGIEVVSATPDWVNLQVRCDPNVGGSAAAIHAGDFRFAGQRRTDAGVAFAKCC